MTTLRGPGVRSVGKPDAGNRHVRFDERGRETGLLAPRPSSTLPKPGKTPLYQRFAVRRESNFRKNLHLIENMAEQVVRWGSIRIAFCRAPSIGFLLV
jgi:hypothetical protein